jgi:hypothetical protein
MFCPKCGEEFPWHVMVCPTCDVETVDRLPAPEPTPDVELVSVLATGDPGLIAVAKSVLEGQEIEYFLRGDGSENPFGLGLMTGFSFGMRPAEFLVRADDADRARALLEGLTAADSERPPSEGA